ncbi:hypothetical protein ON010_g10210 [Phytophthora cinnamomi]|nr:hypothetical protein ON010_g10210 [Phytophthora cinnamomi]
MSPPRDTSGNQHLFNQVVTVPESSAPCYQPADVFDSERTVVTTISARAWANQDANQRLDRKLVQGQDQLNALDLLMTESPMTSVALMMTRDNCQQSPSILERYAQTIPLSASCQSVQKRCLFPDCTKMSVSKGLCRGHGGGRRCHFAGGCTKSAQSRSMFCWAHGGGQRCDVEGCMRSRKTKRFCVAHMHLEADDTRHVDVLGAGKSTRVPRTRRSRYVPVPTRTHRLPSHRLLPSLGQALSAASLSVPSFPVLPQVRARCIDE